jgi:hypothetical protein
MNGDKAFEAALERLQTARLQAKTNPELYVAIEAQDEVLERFQPLFSRDNLLELSAHEFHAFLRSDNNQHWSSLHRHGPRMTEDMDTLRKALYILLYEEGEIADRFARAVPMVTGMGRAVATAILLVVYPSQYGVWNTTSEGGLKSLDLWPAFGRGSSIGEKYAQINDILIHLATALEVDLWTLDLLWWQLEIAGTDTDEPPEPDRLSPATDQLFSIEKHLQDFLWDNWERTSLGQEWERYTEEGSPDAGYEYPCGVGRIDLLAHHQSQPCWLVIELKRGQTSDTTLGQVLRYMGWVKRNLAESGDEVRGLIIAHDVDERLRYALSVTPGVDLQRYEVDFHLCPVGKLDEES